MNAMRRWTRGGLAGLALAVAAAATGCQTWTSGMTLPSGHYLEHPPQYFPPSPPFPLTRELARQAEINQGPPPGAEALPPPAPGRP
jgi:hypothetical protein